MVRGPLERRYMCSNGVLQMFGQFLGTWLFSLISLACSCFRSRLASVTRRLARLFNGCDTWEVASGFSAGMDVCSKSCRSWLAIGRL